MKKESRGPLIVALVLLVLPALYVGSYLALVVPQGMEHTRTAVDSNGKMRVTGWYFSDYRILGFPGGVIFWPLEQIDRKLRPGTWHG